MLINVKKSSGELLAPGGASYYGQSRPADTVPVRSSTLVQVCFYDDNGNPTLLNPATGTLTFTGQPVVGDTFTIGTSVYTAMGSLPTSANQFFIAATLAGTIANFVGAVSASTTNPQVAGMTYGTGTVANPLVTAVASGSTILCTAVLADASGNGVATTTTSASASFGAATLTGADVLSFDIKPSGEYDANFTFVTPTFSAPANPATGYYTGTLTTSSTAGNTLLDPNNPGGGTSSAIEPDAVPLMAQLRWGPAASALPARSNKWSINLTNSVGNGAEGITLDPPSLTLAAVETAVAQAAAGAAALALLPVATNAAKLALPATTTVGTRVEITGEADRIEQYLGGGVGSDANWLVLRNTINVTAYINGSPGGIYNGVSVFANSGQYVNLGWFDLNNFVVSGDPDEEVVAFEYSVTPNAFEYSGPPDQQNTLNILTPSPGTYVIPNVFGLRASVVATINVGAGG